MLKDILIPKKTSAIVLLVCVILLLGFGLVMLHSIDGSFARLDRYDNKQIPFFYRQLMWIGLGLAAMLVMAKIDYRIWRRFALPFFWLVLVMLIFILPLVHPTRGVLSIGPIDIQPSELIKLALILYLAQYLARRQKVREEAYAVNQSHDYDDTFSNYFFGLCVPIFVILIAALPILMEPDFSAVVIILLMGLIMLYIGGVRRRYFIAFIVTIVGWLFLTQHFAPYRWTRLFPFLNASNTCMPLWYSAFFCGGWTGVGLGQSQTVQHFYPGAANHFVASIIGEELGFIGIVFLLLAFVILIVSGIYISIRTRDLFGILLGMGIISFIGLQTMMHLGVVTQLIGFKSLPLPFISYNGSNLVVMLAGIGLLLSISRHED